MAPNDNIDETIVILREERSERTKLQRGIQAVKRDLLGLGSTADAVLDKRIARSTQKGIRNLKALGDAAKRARGEFSFDDVDFGDLEKGGKKGGFADGGNKKTIAAGVAIRNLPAIGPSETIAKVTTTLGRAGISLGQVGAAAAVAVPLVIGLAVVMQQLNAIIAEQSAIFSGVIAGRRAAAGIIATGTKEEVQAALDVAAIKRTIQAAERKQLEADLIATRLALTQSGDALSEVVNAFGDAGIIAAGPVHDLIVEINELNAEIAATDAEVNSYTDALTNNATAAADAVAANKARQAEFDSGQRKQLAALQEFASSSDIEGLDKRIDKLKEDKAVLADFLETENLSVELTKELRAEYVELNREIGRLSGEVRDGVKERADEVAAYEFLKDKLKSVKDGLKEAADAFAKVQEAASKIKDLRDDFDLKIKDILRRGQERIQDAEQDRLDSIADAQVDAADDQAEAARDAGRERVEIERDSNREIDRIRRRSVFDEQNAIQSRNAVALDSARRQRELEVSEAEGDKTDRLRDLRDNLAEQQRTIRKALDNQVRIARVRYSRQVRDAAIAAQRSIAVEREKFERELAIRIQAVQAALGIDVRGETARTQIAASGASQRLQVEGNFVQASLNLWGQAIRAISGASATRQSSTGGSSQSGSFRPTQFASGGTVGRDGLAFVHKGEVISNPRRGQSAPGGGLNVSFSITGQTRMQVKREVMRTLETVLDAAEVA